MPKHYVSPVLKKEAALKDPEDINSLQALSPGDNGSIASDISPSLRPSHQQSSIAGSPTEGFPRTPRTPNRVRFDLDAQEIRNGEHPATIQNEDWVDEDDDFSSHVASGEARSTAQRAPLLTAIEAPSVTVANASYNESSNIQDLPESSRPKSGMLSAFMNMANSIM